MNPPGVTKLATILHALATRMQAGETPPPWPELEQICHQTLEDLAPDVLRDPRIQDIRPAFQTLRAAYEYDLEKAATCWILQHPDPTAAFADHEKYERYVAIVETEMTLIRHFLPAASLAVLFIGSGPLPSTAILLAQQWDCRVDCLDHNQEAYELGVAVVQALKLEAQIHFRCADVFDITDLTQYDAIFVAALAGVGTPEKARVVEHLNHHLQPGQVLVLRAGRGLRTLLYADIAETRLQDFEVCSASAAGATQVEIVACKR